jgi:hypothetical protein
VVDCVPFEQQPAVRAAREAGIPVDAERRHPSRVRGAQSPSIRGEANPDDVAHRPQCPDHSVPLVRLSFEKMIRAGSLQNYLHRHATNLPSAKSHELGEREGN